MTQNVIKERNPSVFVFGFGKMSKKGVTLTTLSTQPPKKRVALTTLSDPPPPSKAFSAPFTKADARSKRT